MVWDEVIVPASACTAVLVCQFSPEDPAIGSVTFHDAPLSNQ